MIPTTPPSRVIIRAPQPAPHGYIVTWHRVDRLAGGAATGPTREAAHAGALNDVAAHFERMGER